MKKILLSMGALAAVVTPIATVISCGNSDSNPLSPDMKKFTTMFSNTTDASLKNTLASKQAGDTVTKTDLKIKEPKLSTGVTATYSLVKKYDAKDMSVSVKVKLSNTDKKTDSKTITVYAKDKLKKDEDYLTNTRFTSKLTPGALKAMYPIGKAKKDMEIDINKLKVDFKLPTKGVTLTAKFRIDWDTTSKQVDLAITLHFDNISDPITPSVELHLT